VFVVVLKNVYSIQCVGLMYNVDWTRRLDMLFVAENQGTPEKKPLPDFNRHPTMHGNCTTAKVDTSAKLLVSRGRTLFCSGTKGKE